MADEQDWASYPDQTHVAATDTFLLRTAAGAGVEVAAGKGVMFRNSNGQYDATDNTINLAAGATFDFPNFSGLIIANRFSTGSVGLYLCGGGAVASLGSSTGSAPGSISYVSGISGYRFTNTGPTTYTFCFFPIRTRPYS